MAAVLVQAHDVGIWFWGCYGGPSNCSIVPESVGQYFIGERPIATEIYPGFGHQLESDGTFRLPGEAATEAIERTRQKYSSLRIKPQVDGCGTVEAYRALVFNETKAQLFINAFVQQAEQHNYDGWNVDWEFGGFNRQDAVAGARFAQRWADALGSNRTLSWCVGETFNIHLPDVKNVTAVTMGTYTSNGLEFLKQLAHCALFPVCSAGLSCSTDSWGHTAPTQKQLQTRFEAIELAGVKKVALFGGNFDFLRQYVPFLQNFVQKKYI